MDLSFLPNFMVTHSLSVLSTTGQVVCSLPFDPTLGPPQQAQISTLLAQTCPQLFAPGGPGSLAITISPTPDVSLNTVGWLTIGAGVIGGYLFYKKRKSA